MRLLFVLIACVFSLRPALSEELASDLSLNQLEADISQAINEYKPQKLRIHFFSSKGSPDFVTEYVTTALAQMEVIGNRNYPQEARGKLYGSVLVYFEIEARGKVIKVEIVRSSGHSVLDAATIKIVNMSSPLPPFPNELKKFTDALGVAKTFKYIRADSPKD